MVSEARGTVSATNKAGSHVSPTQKITGARPKMVSPLVLNRPSWGALCGGVVAHWLRRSSQVSTAIRTRDIAMKVRRCVAARWERERRDKGRPHLGGMLYARETRKLSSFGSPESWMVLNPRKSTRRTVPHGGDDHRGGVTTGVTFSLRLTQIEMNGSAQNYCPPETTGPLNSKGVSRYMEMLSDQPRAS